MRNTSVRLALAVLGLCSASVVAIEVLLTRLLSVVAWYGLGFLVLSLAMLGLAAGALRAGRARAAGVSFETWASGQMLQAALGVLFVLSVAVVAPLSFRLDLPSLASVVLFASAATVPLVAGSAVVTYVLAEIAAPVSVTYAVDLACAALGALVPLACLGPFTASGSLLLIAGVLCAGSVLVDRTQRWRGVLGMLGVAMALWLGKDPTVALEPRWLKGNPRPSAAPRFEAWNAISYVQLQPFSVQRFPLWSPSPTMPAAGHLVANAFIDGEAGTPVYQYSDLAQLNLLRLDATSTAHALRSDGTACVIGIGGGRDLETALVYGHPEVIGVEVNPLMVRMLREVSRESPILDDPRVTVIVGDGREVFGSRNPDPRCAVLQASLVDTWASTAAGAFAHTESTLYTREAWGAFLRRVEPAGIVTFSRWYDPANLSETSRLVSLAMASLLDRGAENPPAHLALVAAGTVATILVSPEPFSPEDVARLDAHIRRFRFELLFGPGKPPTDPVLRTILAARSVRALGDAGRTAELVTEPPSDDAPFFFHLLSPRAWLHPKRTLARAGSGVLAGNVAATLQLLVTFLGALVVGAFLLGPTLLRAAREARPPLPSARATGYFALLGAGYMLAEIALVQRLHVVLGRPSVALVVVLVGLLLATGAGSVLSGRLLVRRERVRIAAVVAAVLLVVLPYAVLGPLSRATMGLPLAGRVAWTGGVSMLVGAVLGMLFPAGLRFVDRGRGAPVALAVNGVSSVVGSVGAILASVWLGIPASFALAGVLYAIAAWAAPHTWPVPVTEPAAANPTEAAAS